MASYNEHFPIPVPVQQNGRHVRRVLIDVTDICVDLKQKEQLTTTLYVHAAQATRRKNKSILGCFARIKK